MKTTQNAQKELFFAKGTLGKHPWGDKKQMFILS